MARTYGKLVPVPAERVLATHDGMTLPLAARLLQFIDTPGHALHHHAIWDERSRGFFTGDTFGLSYREFDVAGLAWPTPTATPVQFDPEPLKATVRRLLGYAPDWVYLTHFGRIGDVARMGELLLAQIDAMVALARQCIGAGSARHARLRESLAQFYLDGVRAHGCRIDDAAVLDLLEMDIELNAQGLAIWLDRAAQRP
jgi:glyoxylase-like metal-dependent hydrolase (beta-lactamase superfamily II)